MEEYGTKGALAERIAELKGEFGVVSISNNQRSFFKIDEGQVTYSSGLDFFEFKELCAEVLEILKG